MLRAFEIQVLRCPCGGRLRLGPIPPWHGPRHPEPARPRPSPWTLTPWRDPTSSRNNDNRTSLNKDPYLGEGEATPTVCPRTPKCGADWPRRTFETRRKGPSC